MKLNEYRDEMMTLLIKVDTRQEELYHRIGRIETHLERLNGKVAEHEKKITSLWSYGVAFVFIASVGINLIMRGF
tara:strand:- start:351 stop:575 length:225 start_codon:yes stop_codon:yes gene_type:complete